MRTKSVVAVMNEGGDAPIELVTDPERFLAKVRDYQDEPELFIDIETEDWWTRSPRVALLQVWDGREVAVFDVLAPGMREVLSDGFVPGVMANERIRKWAHNASYEKRFLGDARVQNLDCTLRLARSIAFHRLPIDTLSLASLAGVFFGVTLDKRLQKADWSIRPLSQAHLRYAADDTVWCARVRTALEAIEQPPRPEVDDPDLIDSTFSDAKLRELDANAELEALRDSVCALMQRENMRRFSGFAVRHSERLEVPLRVLVRELVRVDPSRMLEAEMPVTQEKLDLLTGAHDRLFAACRTTQNPQLHAPWVQRPQREAVSYDVTRDDADRVSRDYQSRARIQRMASALVEELKQRMRKVLTLRGVTAFKAWRLAPGPVSRAIDVRDALELAPPWADTMVPLTKEIQLAIGENGVAALLPATATKSSFVLRWCPKSDPVGAAAQELRSWLDARDEEMP